MSKTKHKENRQRVAERGTQSRESEQFVPARVEVRVPDRTTIIERNKHQQRPEGICEDDGSDDAMVDADEDSHLTGLRQTTANDFPTDEHMPESNEAHQGQVASFSKKSKKKADRKSYASRSRNEKGKATKTRKQANKSSLSSSQACAQTGSTQQLLDGEDRTVSTEAEHHDAGVPVSYAPHGAMNSSPAAFGSSIAIRTKSVERREATQVESYPSAAEVESDDVIPSIEFGRAKRSLQQRTAQFFGSYDTEFTSYAQSGLLSRVTEMDAPTLTLGAPKHDHKNSRTSQAHVAAETLTSVTSVVSKKRRRADEEEVAKAEDNATQAARANTPSSTPDNVNDRKKRKSKDKERASSWQPVDEKDQPEIACTSQTSHDQVNHPASPSLTRPGPSRIERAASHVGTPPDLTLATNSSSDAKKRQKKQKRAKQPQPQLTNQTAPVTDMPPPQRITDIRGGAGTDVNPYLLYTPQKPKDSIKKASNAEASSASKSAAKKTDKRNSGKNLVDAIQRRKRLESTAPLTTNVQDIISTNAQVQQKHDERRALIQKQIAGGTNGSLAHLPPAESQHSVSQSPTPSTFARRLAKDMGQHRPPVTRNPTRDSAVQAQAAGSQPLSTYNVRMHERNNPPKPPVVRETTDGQRPRGQKINVTNGGQRETVYAVPRGPDRSPMPAKESRMRPAPGYGYH